MAQFRKLLNKRPKQLRPKRPPWCELIDGIEYDEKYDLDPYYREALDELDKEFPGSKIE